LAKSIKYFQEAIELDPLYAPAYAGMADSFNIIAFYNFMTPHEACPKAKASAVRALQLDNNLSEAHTALGWVNTFYDWRFEEAEREFRLAIEIKPSFAIAHQYYALFLLAMRRFEEGLQEMRRALELDPLATIIATSYGAAYYFARDHELSVKEHRKALQFDPDFAIAHAFLAGPFVCLERYDEAVNECLRAKALADESIYPTAFLAYAYGMAGRTSEARELLRQLLERSKSGYISSYHIALVYCGLGELERAMEYLERAYKERDNWMVWLNVYPVFDPLRNDPRFQDIIRRVGLP
jgi:tetratricopeptide (TPR) repeat protein